MIEEENFNVCNCGNELPALLIQCICCGSAICAKCEISNDMSLCIFCHNDQLFLINSKEEENMRGLSTCKFRRLKSSCVSKDCGAKIEFCERHSAKCTFCGKNICYHHNSERGRSPYCDQHKGKICDGCGDKFRKTHNFSKMCIICRKYYCYGCARLILDKEKDMGICKAHALQCMANTYLDCRGTYYPLNPCNVQGCDKYSCKCCRISISGQRFSACENHVKICYYMNCFQNFADPQKGVIKWKNGIPQEVCRDCYQKVKQKINIFKIILNLYNVSLPKYIIDKIIRYTS